ncbi:MAG: glutamate racemase [Chitinophagales bacterium]|nr:glutamate racemase [Bacteroidota bacterium]
MQQPLGIFDSGIGGLTVANAIVRALPHEKIIYFGDTAHMPYGEKSPAAIQHYSRHITNFLLQKNCKAIVVACNTASAVASEYLREILPANVPLINVIDPLISDVQKSALTHIGIIGTKATIASGVYSRKLRHNIPHVRVVAKASRSLAQIIEEGLYQNPPIIQALIEHYLGAPDMENIEGLILACTHYPLIKNDIDYYYKSSVKIFDSTEIVAENLRQQLHKQKILDSTKKIPQHHFFVSDLTDSFTDAANLFFGKNIHLELADIWND